MNATAAKLATGIAILKAQAHVRLQVEQQILSAYSWAVDGYGRQFICLRCGREVLFCMLPGVPAPLGVELLEDQDACATR